MSKYVPEIGDVVLWNGITMAVVAMKSHENFGSVCYDREYLLCEEELLHDKDVITLEELDKCGTWVQVQGLEFPEIEKACDIAPYEIKSITAFKLRQKKAKTITMTVFE